MARINNPQIVERYKLFMKEKEEIEGGFFKKFLSGTKNTFSRICLFIFIVCTVNRPKNNGGEFYEYLTNNKISTLIQFSMGNFDEVVS